MLPLFREVLSNWDIKSFKLLEAISYECASLTKDLREKIYAYIAFMRVQSAPKITPSYYIAVLRTANGPLKLSSLDCKL